VEGLAGNGDAGMGSDSWDCCSHRPTKGWSGWSPWQPQVCLRSLTYLRPRSSAVPESRPLARRAEGKMPMAPKQSAVLRKNVSASAYASEQSSPETPAAWWAGGGGRSHEASRGALVRGDMPSGWVHLLGR
jgi:hypothetical protein